MPIPREAFDKDLHPDDAKVIEFLDRHGDQAFTLDELMQQAGVNTLTLFDSLGWRLKLMRLVDRGLVVAKYVGNDIFYASAPK